MMDVCLNARDVLVDAAAQQLSGVPSEVPLHPAECAYLRYAPILRRLALRRYDIPLGDVDALVNDVFATYLTKPDEVRNLESYLIAGICNASRDYWRERNREVSLDTVEDFSVADALEGLPERLLLAAALARLRERCRTVLCRYYFDGEKTETIAEEINTSPSNVLYLLHQCRQRAKRIVDAMSQVR